MPEPGWVDADVRQRATRVKLLALDVDGVLTDGGMYYSAEGEVLKKFNTRDAQGVALWQGHGLLAAIITREQSPIVLRRGAKMGVAETHVGVQDKLACVRELVARYGLTLDEVCYVGDDVHDVALMREVGLAVAVADATPLPKRYAHYVTRLAGGQGAVREVCELLLDAQGRSNDV
jgi:3-deoxy-D-manno-octulosonate 8-phosphate phosphatase (KDO 8-P phosphatase)